MASDRIMLVSIDSTSSDSGAVYFGHPIRIERTLKGPPMSAPLEIRFVLPTTEPGPRALLFLKLVEPGLYEPTILGAGIVPVVGDRVPPWGLTLSAALARIEDAARGAPPTH